VDQRDVHAPDESDPSRLAEHAGNDTDQERTLFLPELQARQVVGERLARPRVEVDAGEFDVGIVGRDLPHRIAEEETDADDDIVTRLGQLPEAGLPVGVLAGLELRVLDTELVRRVQKSPVGGVVERLVSLTADVEDHPDPERPVGTAGLIGAAATERHDNEGGEREDREQAGDGLSQDILLGSFPGRSGAHVSGHTPGAAGLSGVEYLFE